MAKKIKKLLGKKKIVKGKPLTIWIITIVIISLLISFGSGILVGKLIYEKEDNNYIDSPNETQATENEIDMDLFEDLKNIGMLYEEDYSPFFDPFLTLNGYASDLDSEQIVMVVFKYAARRGIVSSVTGEEYYGCLNGEGLCSGINVEDFKSILRKYNITSFDTSEFDVYNDMYIFSFGGDTIENKIEHDISVVYTQDEYIITDKMKLVNVDTGNLSKVITKEYTFKKYDDGTYYLSTVYEV